jgi:WD40 repeat protein
LAEEEKSGPSTMQVIHRLQHKSYVQGLAWSSDGSKLATLSDFGALVTIWNAKTWEKVREIRQYGAAYAGPGIGWTLDGNLLTSAGAKTQAEGIYSMNLWDPASGALIKRIEGPPIPPGATKHNQASTIAVSKSGSMVAVVLGHIQDKVTIFNAIDWSILRIIELEGLPPFKAGLATAIAFTPNENSVAIANGVNFQIFDLQNGRKRISTRAYESNEAVGGPIVDALSFSPDGNYLATGPNFFSASTDRNPVRIWDTASGESIFALPGTGATTRAIDWSADGTRVAAVSDRKLTVWDVRDLKKSQPLSTFDKVSGLALAFSPSGLLAATDDSVALILR